VRRLKQMRAERAQRRELAGNVRMELAHAGASGRKVIEARDVSFAYGGRVLVRDFSTTILRGDRIGLIGPNGSGKTTLLKLLLGELAPQAGEVRQGTQLQVAYFDQYRATLREDWNALENVAEGQDFVEVNGKPQARDRATCRTSCSRPSARARRSPACPAASATGCCWRSCSRSRPTCW
jgi:ABC transport system ATP-binding/permease protein